MATYKADMRPALEYASAIWSSLDTTSELRNTHTSHTRALTVPRPTIQTENETSISSLTQTYYILKHSKAKTIYSTTAATQQKFTHIPTQSLLLTKKNMRHIHTSIVSMHLATRGNNKILRTPPPHIISSEETLPYLTRRTLTQPRTNKSPFLKSYLHKVDAKSHTSSLCPFCRIHTHTTHIISSTAPTYAPRCHPGICGQTPLE